MTEESTTDNRYDRQELIEGWDQRKLTASKVTVIGTDIAAHFTALSLAALGFGEIEIIGPGHVTEELMAQHEVGEGRPDYSKGWMYFDSSVGVPRAQAIADFVSKINPMVRAYGVNLDLCRSNNMAIVGKPDIIIDTTNDPASKFGILEYARRKRIPSISVVSNAAGAGIGFYSPGSLNEERTRLLENLVFAEYSNQAQDSTSSQLIAGLAADEARKHIMPLNHDIPIEDIVLYNMASDTRFDAESVREIFTPADLSGKKIVMIGAGALGTFAGLDLVLNNVGTLIIVDFDDVEAHNLNRQVLYYDSVGEIKSEALAARLKSINPRCNIEYIKEKIVPESESFFETEDYNLLIDTVDNNKARALLNYFSSKYQKKFISGGTRHDSGQVTIYVPGQTACLNCQVDIDRMALDGYTPTSCIYAPTASVITSNQITGSMMVGEAKSVLSPDRYGEPIHKILKYVSGEALRLATLPTNPHCECHSDTERLETWMEVMGHIYSG
jgi:molybdopterin/thiamine biosynthesis adenylyltransferase